MSSSSILLNKSELFLDWIAMCNEKWVVYDNWRWPVQCGWTEKKLQSSSQSWTCTQKWSWSLFGRLLPIWSTAAFWIPVKPLYLWSVLSRSMRCTKNCNSCSHHWLTERVQFFCTTTPDLTWHSQRFKHWTHWTTKFCFIHHIHLLTNYHLLLQASRKFFAGNMLPQPAGGRKCFPRVGQILKHRLLCYWNKQTYFSLSKMCWL